MMPEVAQPGFRSAVISAEYVGLKVRRKKIYRKRGLPPVSAVKVSGVSG